MASKLIIVVRSDLAMTTGKIAAQVAHAAVAAALATQETPAFRAWDRDGQPKVVLRAGSLTEMERIAEAAGAAGLPIEVIHDAGRTQVEAGTATCCAVGPGEDSAVDAVTGDLPLL